MTGEVVVRVHLDPTSSDGELAADALWEFGAVAVGETPDGLDAGFADSSSAQAAAAELDGQWTVEVVADDGRWRHAWRASAAPVHVPPFVVRLPEHDTPPAGLIDLVVEPGDAFGTGGHPTTRACLTELSHVVAPGSRLLDVGTGTGVLAVAAAHLGASSVTAIDTDPAAVDVATANVARHGFAARIRVASVALDDVDGAFDVVVANLGGSIVLARLGAALVSRVGDGGHLIVGGILAAPGALPFDVGWFPGAVPVRRRADDGWETIVLAVR